MDTKINSCFMLAVNLDMPVDLGCLFDFSDLKDTGLELDSHITILYAQEKELPKDLLLNDTKIILNEYYSELENLLKDEHEFNLMNMFDLSSFENDSDYIVLKLKKDTNLFKYLTVLNKSLRNKYGVLSEFSTYNPHISLAELNTGTAKKYVKSEKLKKVLENTTIDFDDLILSYGKSNEKLDRKQYYLTQYNCVDRYFRLQRLNDELTK